MSGNDTSQRDWSYDHGGRWPEDVAECIDAVWPNLPECAPHPGPGAVIVPCPKRSEQ